MRRFFLSLIFGAVLGVGIGLMIGWVVAPVQVIDSPMSDLSRRYKDEYTVMVAIAFQVDGDLTAAVNRLKPLGEGSGQEFNVFTYVRDVTERYISAQGTGRESDIRSLVELSCAMAFCTEPMQRFLPPR
ncbi:MAG: hypothetical protein U0528_01525 [Anaerolineae bacterium]|nr:hypothetical protein [Anaerolineae bacterium]